MNLLESLLFPKRVAVIGASPNQKKVGGALLSNLLGFSGDVYPINPKYDHIGKLKCYPSVLDAPPCELAIIAVPASIVPEVMEQCGDAGVKAVVVISAGFKETGVPGLTLERGLLEIAKRYGIRVLGPNCLGISNPRIGLNATFSATSPVPGKVAVVSQSGALLTSVLDWAHEVGIGFSAMVSLGNKADLDENDLLELLEEDDGTEIIVLYLEGTSDGRRLMKLAGRIRDSKPIIVLKSGRTREGSRAVSSHTGSLAGSDMAYTAAFRQCGVLRVEGLGELFDLLECLTSQPLPKGNRVGVITNAGGLGILQADACVKEGLKLPEFSQSTIDSLRSHLPSGASLYNPVDVLGDSGAEEYARATSSVMADEGVDSVVCLTSPQAMTDVEAIAEALVGIKGDKPLLSVMVGGSYIKKGREVLRSSHIPAYSYPQQAARVLRNMVDYTTYQRDNTQFERYPVDDELVESVFSRAKSEGKKNLGVEDMDLLRAYGIQVARSYLTKTPEDARRAAADIGDEVVMKVVSPDISHKTEVKGVRVGVSSDDVPRAYESMLASVRRYAPGTVVHGVLIQEMVRGKETIVGASEDFQFGRLMMFGLGGIYVEVLKDVSFRVPPLTPMESRSMVTEIKTYPLIAGVRGEERYDVDAIVDVLLRLSQLLEDHPEIVEFDINPLMVLKKGAVAVDFRATIKWSQFKGEEGKE
ncbi:MAG: acetate--CoA ligase family protein [Methermicoccaceae archaeon]